MFGGYIEMRFALRLSAAETGLVLRVAGRHIRGVAGRAVRGCLLKRPVRFECCSMKHILPAVLATNAERQGLRRQGPGSLWLFHRAGGQAHKPT